MSAQQPAESEQPSPREMVEVLDGFKTDDADTWHRVHPVSPLVRGWIAVAAVIFIFGRNSLDSALTGGLEDGGAVAGGAPVLLIVAVVGAAVVIFGVAFFLAWRFTRYQVTDENVHINSGIIFRQQRRARIDRVQAIDVVQPLLARAFGLAELKFDVADGGKSAIRLSFLKLGEAKRLRAAILARAAGLTMEPGQQTGIQEAPESPVLALAPVRIIGAAIFSSTTVIALGLVAAVTVAVVWSGEPTIYLATLPMFVGVFASYWKTITNDLNFRVATSPDGVRLHYGLLETRSQTIPPGRVQAVCISQGPVWRPFGWYRVHVNVAGYGQDTSGSSRSVVLPVGTVEEVMAVLGLVFPDPGVERPFDVFTAGLRGVGGDEGFVHSPRTARWIDPLSWRHNAFRATDTALLCRRGRFFRSLQVVPHERTQSLGLRQGPLLARLGLANFELHSTVGPIRPRVHHLSASNGRQLFDEQSVRAATARRIQRNERWLVAGPSPVPEGQATDAPAPADISKNTPQETQRGN